MHPILVKVLLLGMLVVVGSTQADARSPNPEPLRKTFVPEKNAFHTQTNPLIELSRAFFSSQFYEKMLSNPDFIKLQGITEQLWENQTGKKHMP